MEMTEYERGYRHGFRDAQRGGLLKVSVNAEPTIAEKIKLYLCQYFKITWKTILSPCKKTEIVYPRQVIIFLLMKHTNMGCVKIAREVKRDHATILYTVGRIQDLIDVEPQSRNEISALSYHIMVNIIIPVEDKQVKIPGVRSLTATA